MASFNCGHHDLLVKFYVLVLYPPFVLVSRIVYRSVLRFITISAGYLFILWFMIISTGVVENIWTVNMEAFWDPPSNSGGEIIAYLARIHYTRNGFPRYEYNRNIDPTVRWWKPDPFPSERPVYVQVGSS